MGSASRKKRVIEALTEEQAVIIFKGTKEDYSLRESIQDIDLITDLTILISIEDFLKRDSVVKAVRVYRERNGCTLRETRDAVDEMKKKMEAEKNGGNGNG